MANIDPVIAKVNREVRSITWSNITENDTPTAWTPEQGCPTFVDKSVHILGTGGGATYAIQGSNNGTDYVNLTDPQGNALASLSTGVIEQIIENTLYLKPVRTGGSSSDVTIIIAAKGILQLF